MKTPNHHKSSRIKRKSPYSAKISNILLKLPEYHIIMPVVYPFIYES